MQSKNVFLWTFICDLVTNGVCALTDIMARHQLCDWSTDKETKHKPLNIAVQIIKKVTIAHTMQVYKCEILEMFISLKICLGI